jgi:DMSO reductase family type II enzyme heme b subunit
MGQYAAAPRWQAPAVDYVRVCALHDEREVAIRVEWHDPFEDTGAEADEPAPEEDPEGAPLDEPAVEEPLDEPVDEAAVEDEPLEPVDEAAVEDEPLEPVDEAPIEDEPPDDPAEVGDDEEMLDEAGSGDDEEMVDEAVEDSERVPTYISIAEMNARAEAGPIPDRLALHMPAGARDPEDAERPHMFMGDAEHPVHAWLWSADSGGTFTEGRAIGPSEDYDTEGSVQLSGQSRWEAGRWRVVFRRAMTTPDAEDAQLGSGVLMPFTIRIWDGSAGERGLQSATSSWQYVYVEAPIPARAYVRGAVGLGLGYLFVGLGWFGLRRRGRGAG